FAERGCQCVQCLFDYTSAVNGIMLGDEEKQKPETFAGRALEIKHKIFKPQLVKYIFHGICGNSFCAFKCKQAQVMILAEIIQFLRGQSCLICLITEYQILDHLKIVLILYLFLL